MRRRFLALLWTVVMVASLLMPVNGSAQDSVRSDVEAGPAAFVAGSNRILVHQTQVVEDGADYGLSATSEPPGAVWVISILDITNFGTMPQALSMGDFQLLVSDGDDRVSAESSQGLSVELEFADVQTDGSVTIPVDAAIRLAMAFAIPGEALGNGSAIPDEPRLAFGDDQVNIGSTVVDELDSSILPAVESWAGIQGSVQTVPGTGTIEVNIAGTIQTAQLAGVATPPADGCFGAESAAAVLSLSSGPVWVEDDSTSDGSLIWYWDAGRGHLGLMNESLVEQGLGAYDDGYDGAYAAWLMAKSDSAEKSETGLWDTCRGAAGEWINPPTPAPVPTKTADEVRAEYTWVDIRDLAIRPQQFEGEQVAFQGEVFNIPTGPGEVFEFQVMVATPTGDTEAGVRLFRG